MKICILFNIKDGPFGGGNQFIKALRNEFIKKDVYAEDPGLADVFLFNSFQNIQETIKFKKKYPDKLFIHRVDGPISLYRNNSNILIDKLIFYINNIIADCTIFQSKFSFEQNKKLGIHKKSLEEIIFNAPDNSIFYQKNNYDNLTKRKIKLISVSWSSNKMKGFDVYDHIDKHLDFDRYQYTFIGNSPVSFRNIKIIPPQPSKKVAEILRESDIYITASQKDPCSNSLIEALSCGLPAIALNDGGHPELVKSGGEIFNNNKEILEKIDLISSNYESYASKIPKYHISDIADEYISVACKLSELQTKKNYTPKKLSALDILKIELFIISEKILDKLTTTFG